MNVRTFRLVSYLPHIVTTAFIEAGARLQTLGTIKCHGSQSHEFIFPVRTPCMSFKCVEIVLDVLSPIDGGSNIPGKSYAVSKINSLR